MTKEELEKEAVKYAEKINLQNVNISGVVRNHISQAYLAGAEPREKRITELETQIEKMKCCENCGWFYLQQHWKESKEIDESRMFHCGTCGNKRNWKIKEIKEK